MGRKRTTLTPAQIKAQRDLIHTRETMSPKQAARMREGRTESRLDDYMTVSPISKHAGEVRRAIEDRMLAKSLGL
jgi:hypothetical protein